MPSPQHVLRQLKAYGSAEHRASKVRLGLPPDSALGVPMPVIRQMGKDLGRDQKLAEALWDSGYHEARLLAVQVAEPETLTPELAEKWLGDVVSWDLCDHLCNNLLIELPFAVKRIAAWAADEREFVRRAAFSLICSLSIHHTAIEKPLVEQHLGLIRRYARDPRNYVKKAVSWALREIGKKDHDYGALAQTMALARELAMSANAAERWVGKDALKELETLTTVPGRRRLVSSKTKSGGAARKSAAQKSAAHPPTRK